MTITSQFPQVHDFDGSDEAPKQRIDMQWAEEAFANAAPPPRPHPVERRGSDRRLPHRVSILGAVAVLSICLFVAVVSGTGARSSIHTGSPQRTTLPRNQTTAVFREAFGLGLQLARPMTLTEPFPLIFSRPMSLSGLAHS